MGRTSGTCSICGRDNIELNHCSICGSDVCSRCFVPDVHVCTGCTRKGLWVESPKQE